MPKSTEPQVRENFFLTIKFIIVHDLLKFSVYESEAAKGFVESHEKPPQEKGVKLGGAAANLEKDPRAPTPTTEAPPFPGSNQPGLSSAGSETHPDTNPLIAHICFVNPLHAGGPEPGLIRSFQAMSTEEKTSPPEAETAPMGETEQHQTQSEQGYKEKITSTVVDKAFHAKEAAVMAAAGTAEYGKKIAESVYEKVTPQKKEEEKAELAGQGSKPTDKWVTMKEYLSEKLSPGEEDRALCEVISESMQKRKEEEGDIREETEAKEAASGEKKSRKGVVGKIKGAVVSVFGGQHSSPVKARGEEVQSIGVEKERAPRLQESAN